MGREGEVGGPKAQKFLSWLGVPPPGAITPGPPAARPLFGARGKIGEADGEEEGGLTGGYVYGDLIGGPAQ